MIKHLITSDHKTVKGSAMEKHELDKKAKALAIKCCHALIVHHTTVGNDLIVRSFKNVLQVLHYSTMQAEIYKSWYEQACKDLAGLEKAGYTSADLAEFKICIEEYEASFEMEIKETKELIRKLQEERDLRRKKAA